MATVTINTASKRVQAHAAGRKPSAATAVGRGPISTNTPNSTSTSLPLPSDDSSYSDTPAASPVKRRKLRKGTFSCIECKRRKVRCRFAESVAAAPGSGGGRPSHAGHCLSCQRHGTACVSQEYAAPSPSPRRSPDPLQQRQYNDVGKRIAQVEALVGELVRRRVNAGHATSDSVLGDDDAADEPARSPSDPTADLLDQELESVLQQDASCFSFWLHDRFISAQSPHFRARSTLRSQSLSPLPATASPHLRQPPGYLDPNTDTDLTTDFPAGRAPPVDVHSKRQLRIQLQQLEQELFSNRLLFPTGPSIYTGPLEHQTLSKHLQSILPTANDALRILDEGALFTLRRYRAFLAADAEAGRDIHPLEKRGTGHPVLLARELIQLAVCLQLMHKDSKLSDYGMSGSVTPWETADRYFEVASSLVTSHDAMVSSQEGLESLLLHAFFVVNKGDLRAGWMTLRRALSIATIIGLPPRSWHDQPLSLHFVWTRLLFSERFLSLMLGLPSFNIEDHHPSSLARHAATRKLLTSRDWTNNVEYVALDLERLNALLIPRITARNKRLNQLANAHYIYSRTDYARHITILNNDYRDTRDIDYTFCQAAQSLPTKWWAIPDILGGNRIDGGRMEKTEQIEESMRLMGQAKHYHLLVLLHLPYLTDRRPGIMPAKAPPPLLDTVLPDGASYAGAQGPKDETINVNLREYGMAAGTEAASRPVTDDIVFAEDTSRSQRQYPSLPSPPSNWSSIPAATAQWTSEHINTTTTSILLTPPDTTFSRLGALGAAREVLSRFMVFRKFTSANPGCHAFDFEGFVAAVAILLAHLDAHVRGGDNVIHYQRPSDMNTVDKAMALMDRLQDIAQEPVNGPRLAILRRLMAIENDAAAGGKYEVWTEDGTLGRGDGRLTADPDSAVQTMSVPYYGTIHIWRLVGSS
ncbi:uncharacterized protein SPSK_08507 [Sporothrix schenckii 1099-18]|uniref:Zn(2)-C6 fungal-type domain-containing protein n=1 Tax=Sporothrix schenckii 1099-18 TaxID=1397361 RepID=A0A0F2M918_SPOSC|nr:uncharacterized protein SPSK_08507 [Sporothrix schenckii 1099-18]KJR84656.1 hypothetical protein SPSK_08507 [Sporothrix schenckii 1099-18]